ncbi:colanic acid biosynthesis acetyltransferase WcaB, partial [Escherichia coli]
MLEDLRANSWSLRPCCMVLAYRVAHFCSVWRKKNVLNNLWAAPLLVLYRIITECFFGYEIQAAATIGRRFTIHHGYAVVINKNVVAGDDFTIRHGVTIGNQIFELRIYAAEMGHRMPLRHEIHQLILAGFHAHGIDMPFPPFQMR